MGYSTALHLALRGVTCQVLEKDSPGRHASGVNAGGLRKLNRHPAEIPLSVAASRIWQRIGDLVGSDCDARFPGQLRVAENAADMAKLDFRHERSEMNWPKLAVSARTVLALFPQLHGVRMVRSWAGIEGFTPDGLPIIGRSPNAPGAFHACGFSAHGFQLSPVVGRILSQLVLDGESDLPIGPFDPGRFADR